MIGRPARCLTLAAGLGLLACGEATAPEAERLASAAETRIFLSSGISSESDVPPPSFSVNGLRPPVAPFQIHALSIAVDRVEAKPAEGPWSTVWARGEGEDPLTFDLAALEAGELELVAAAELGAGAYENVRLSVSSAWISFEEAVEVGNVTYAPYTEIEEHDLTIPSGVIKIPTAHFEVGEEEGGVLVIVFQADASAAAIAATGSGRLLMRPVLVEGDEELEEATSTEEEEGEEEEEEEEEEGS